jgi:hypothetical protein
MHPFTEAWSIVKSSAVVWGPFVSAVVAAFIAAFTVHLLTQSREREKWILDCKKQEFKELLNTISDSYSKRLRTHVPLPQIQVLNEDDQREIANIQSEVFRAFRNCLYICYDLDLKALSNNWLAALQGINILSLHSTFNEVSLRIVQAANRSVPKSRFERLQFWKGFSKRRTAR